MDSHDLRPGDVLLLKGQKPARITAVATRPSPGVVYNFAVDELHCYAVGVNQVLVHNECSFVPLEEVEASAAKLKAADDFSANINQGKNFLSKVRKHIDQVRNRLATSEAIPKVSQGGAERVWEIIQQRVAQGGGRPTTFAGEAAIAFEDGGVTYIFRESGEFWTILGN